MSDEIEVIAKKIDNQWNKLYEDIKGSGYESHMIQLFPIAQRSEVLGKLFPFLSMGRLCFSRCTDFPYYVDVLIAPVQDKSDIFAVQLSVGQGQWVDVRTIGYGTAQEAVLLATSSLPSTYGSALLGNRLQNNL